MGGKERLNLFSAGVSELGNGRPPLLATRDAKREFGERHDAVSMKCVHGAREQPAGNVVSNRGYRHCGHRKGLNALNNKPCVLDAFGRAVIEEFGKVVAVAGKGTAYKLAPNLTEHASR